MTRRISASHAVRRRLSEEELMQRDLEGLSDEQWSMVLSEVARKDGNLCCNADEQLATITGRRRERDALHLLAYEHAGCRVTDHSRDYYPDNVLWFAGQGAQLDDDPTHGKLVDRCPPEAFVVNGDGI